MKQLTVSDLLSALKDEPISIGHRLELLGFANDELANKFSSEILGLEVYGSSFLKFLQDNEKVLGIEKGIPADELPENFKNPFDAEERKIGDRLADLGLSVDDASQMFGGDILSISLNGTEFQDFLVKSHDKVADKLSELASRES